MSLLLSAMTIGFILSLLALGVYISFKIFEFPDITAEGTITTGAAVAAVLLVHKWPPMAAMAVAMIAGLRRRSSPSCGFAGSGRAPAVAIASGRSGRSSTSPPIATPRASAFSSSRTLPGQ